MADNKMWQVAAMNNFDKLLGENGKLVKLRKEQVLAGAMYIIQQHYADKQNKMEAVAQLFGKKLYEEFEIYYKDENYTAYFRNEGLRVRGVFYLTWDSFLVALLTGGAVIVDEDR